MGAFKVFSSAFYLSSSNLRSWIDNWTLRWKERVILRTPINVLLEWLLAARSSRLAYIPIEEFHAILENSESSEEINQNCGKFVLCKKSLKKKEQIQSVLNNFDRSTFDYIRDKKEDTDAYIFCNERTLVIAFRGTSFTFADGFSFNDVKHDLKVNMVPFAGGNVHSGFLDQYLAIQDELFSKTAAFIEKFKPQKILITGHSLGGALANLCAVDFFDRFEPEEQAKIRCITFGAPKPGDAMFCAVFRKKVAISHRLVLPYDPIPKVPPNVPMMRYEHPIKKMILRNPKNKAMKMIPTESHHYENYLEAVEDTKKTILNYRFRNAVRNARLFCDKNKTL